MNRLARTVILTLGILGLVVFAPAPVGAQVPSSTPTTISLWAPEYTSYLPLPGYDGAIDLAADGDALWLATETEVSRFADGVWEEPQSPPGVSKIFTLAPTGGAVWAFGFEGGAWRRQGRSWTAIQSPVTADLYSAVARGPSDIWAAGFDYNHETGVLVHWNGTSLLTATEPPLAEQLLFAIAKDPTGELWAGGCNYTDQPVLLRDGRSGHWRAAAVPPITGCVYNLAFSPDGLGLAAVGSDILTWDGVNWTASGIAPPADYQWVRVAGTAMAAGAAREHTTVGGTGWAIAGVPTWRSYTDGQSPWYFDGYSWQPAEVDYRGLDILFVPSSNNPEPKPFVSLAANEANAWSVSRVGGAPGVNGEAAIMTLGDGTVRFDHPLLEFASTVDALSGSDVWVGGRTGTVPLLHHGAGGWTPATGAEFSTDQRTSVERIDMASPTAGWALGTVSENPLGFSPAQRAAWRWDGKEWLSVPPVPANMGTVRLRALPDGSAWVAGLQNQVVAFDGEQWSALKDAPPLSMPRVHVPPEGLIGAPFDIRQEDGRLVGCLSAKDGMYSYEDGVFRRVGANARGQVIDLQLTGPGSGWAIGLDRSGQSTPGTTSGVLLRIKDCHSTEVKPDLFRKIAARPQTISNVEWEQLSAVSETEVWLWGTLSGPGLFLPVLARAAKPDGDRGLRDWDFHLGCDVSAMSAIAVPGGTDVWLATYRPCGLNAAGTTNMLYAGPVSRMMVRELAGRVYLPAVVGGEDGEE